MRGPTQISIQHALPDWLKTPTKGYEELACLRDVWQTHQNSVPTSRELLKPKLFRDVRERMLERKQVQTRYQNRKCEPHEAIDVCNTLPRIGNHVSLEIAFVEKCDNSLKLLDTFRSAEATSAHLKAIGGNHHMQHTIRKCQFLKQAWNVESATHAAKVRSPVKIAPTGA